MNAQNNNYFVNDAWIECNGIKKCESGPFKGEFCSDLSDRVLVGKGNSENDQVLQLKNASLPDHAHRHKHGGKYESKAKYRTGPERYTDSGKALGWGDGSMGKKHHHDEYLDAIVPIDFSKMNETEAFISKVKNPNISVAKEQSENLYSPHMRVKFMFKCY